MPLQIDPTVPSAQGEKEPAHLRLQFSDIFNVQVLSIAIGITLGVALLNFVNAIISDLVLPMVSFFLHLDLLNVIVFGEMMRIGDFLIALLTFVFIILILSLLVVLIRFLLPRLHAKRR